ncbi:MAG: hypothetical protein U0165_14475 [Polyangiaceae bacterium]
MVIDIGGEQSTGWTIAVPAGVTTFKLPDLRAIPGAGLIPGTLSVTISFGKLDSSYECGELVYRQLTARAWTAYSKNVFYVQLPHEPKNNAARESWVGLGGVRGRCFERHQLIASIAQSGG